MVCASQRIPFGSDVFTRLAAWVAFIPLIHKACRRGDMHPYQVTPDKLSQEFKKARNASGVYSSLDSKERPSFHDLRALRIFYLKKQDMTKPTFKVWRDTPTLKRLAFIWMGMRKSNSPQSRLVSHSKRLIGNKLTGGSFGDLTATPIRKIRSS